MTVGVCFRVKCILSNDYSQYTIDPDKRADIQLCLKITSPAFCRWRDNFVDIPDTELHPYVQIFNEEKSDCVLYNYQINASIVELYVILLS